MSNRRLRRRGRRTIVLVAVAVAGVLAVAGYAAYTTIRQVVVPYLAGPGCQAGTGRHAVLLDTEQAGIAATIAGVAARDRLPRRAVVIAYATAMQESHMHNLDYGDRDSVGVFQQRPSQGWGTTSELENPVYATSRFFAALVRVPGYLQMPVAAAAQAVQRSADGAAYARYDRMATALADAFTGATPHAVWCWGTGGSRGAVAVTAAVRAIDATFGPMAVTDDTVVRSDGAQHSPVLRVPPRLGWTVAAWLVTHAPDYGIDEVGYDGYGWRSSVGARGWHVDPAAGRGSILLH